METIAKIRLKVMPTFDANALCKDAMTNLVTEVRDCKIDGSKNCNSVLERKARSSFKKILHIDSSAISRPKCRELATIARMN